jgi:D-alanine-D-alanine ligase
MSRTSVLVLMGGPDAEREVSLRSGGRVAQALRDDGTFDVIEQVVDAPTAAELARLPGDVVFPVLHGPWGEGGPLQELLEAAGRPFVGCGSKAARIAMDKAATKTMAARAGVPTPRSRVLRRGDEPPVVIKPSNDGSSVDLFVCNDRDDVDRALATAFSRRELMLAEEFIRGREITVGWLHGSALPIVEIVPAEGLYDYEAKYVRKDTRYVLDPELPAGVAERAQAATVEVCRALGCRHISRVDFMVDDRGPWMLEVNTMPGMTDTSLVPKAAAHAGMPFPLLCRRLVEYGLADRSTQR